MYMTGLKLTHHIHDALCEVSKESYIFLINEVLFTWGKLPCLFTNKIQGRQCASTDYLILTTNYHHAMHSLQSYLSRTLIY